MLGEHSDWAASYRREEHPHIPPGICLAYCTDVGIDLEGQVIQKQPEGDNGGAASPTGGDIVLHYSFVKKTKKEGGGGDGKEAVTEELVERHVPFSMDALEQHAKAGDFFAHVCGAAAEMLHRFGDNMIRGIKRYEQRQQKAQEGPAAGEAAAAATPTTTVIQVRCVSMSLPMKKGLSSSAAIGVALARLFGSLAGITPAMQEGATGDEQEQEQPLGPEHEMDIAYRAELRTGSQCGRLDQVVAHGPNAFVRMCFDGSALPSCEKLNVSVPLFMVVCDLNAGKDTRTILRDLNSAYPTPADDVDRGVHEALGAENHRLIAAAEDALRSGDAAALGAVFTAAQKVFREKVAPKCIKELASPRLYQVLDDERVRRASLGGKGVGSQGDGSAQFVCRDAAQQEELCAVLRELGCTPMKFTLQP